MDEKEISTITFSGAFSILLLLATQGAHGQTDVVIRVPEATSQCLLSSEYHPVPKNSITQACLQELLWYFETPAKLTDFEALFFKNISRLFLDQARNPPSGFRQRKEYRQLTSRERDTLHRTFQILYDEGTIHLYGQLFASAYPKVRNSPAFLSFQRVFLVAFEEELRRVDNTTVLPYWDYTIDAELDNPVNSILWSRKFFGNGNGRVVIGDFRDWRSPKGHIRRRYGESNYGRLMTRDVVKIIASKCSNKDISYPIQLESEEDHVLEYHHNGVLNWLGGTAADASTAAYDPVFYMVSACTDYIWEVFRRLQDINCNIESALDYPTDFMDPEHDAFAKMAGFADFANAHGYSSYWTRFWYNYTRALTCPDCQSEYLWCNRDSSRCVSHSRRTDFNIGGFPALTTEDYEPLAEFVPHKVSVPFMPSPLNDGRTMASARVDAKNAVERLRASAAAHTQDQLLSLGALSNTDWTGLNDS